jgi:transcriptional regulator GlxA family with amidase domain
VARKVVILGFPGVQALDLVGPFDVFTGASLLHDGAYEVALASVDGQPVATGTGLSFQAAKLPDPREPVDTVLLPGGQTQFAAPVWMPRARRTPIRDVQEAIEARPVPATASKNSPAKPP